MARWTVSRKAPRPSLWSVILVGGLASTLLPTAARGDAATDGVVAATKAYAEAFNAGNADRFIEFWAADADYTSTDGEIFRGRDAIRELIAADDEALKGSKLKITETTNRTLKPEVVVQDGVLEFASPDGLIDRSRYTAVWVQNGGKWQLSSVRDLGPLPSLEVPVVRENPLLQLDAFRGQWEASDDIAAVQLAVDWKLDKQFLQFDYTVSPKGGSAFTILQLVGWDPVDEVVRSWFFDSTGGHGSGVWEKTDAGWSVLSSGVTPTGQLGGGLYDYAVEKDALSVKISQREVAGQSIPDAELKFVRKPNGSK